MRFVSNLRYSFRTLAKSPGFAIIAILSLALGVGANTAMFSYVDALLLRPLPVADPHHLIEVDSTTPTTRFGGISYADYVDFRDQSKTVDAMACYTLSPMGYAASRDAVPKVALGVVVSWNFFSGLGIDIPVGRSFRPDEDQVPGRDLVTVISHSLWENEFASSPSAIGKKLRVNGADFTVIGVAPEKFNGPEQFVLAQLYVPMNSYPKAMPNAKSDYLTNRSTRSLTLLGYLKPGVKPAGAQAELKTIAARLGDQYPATNRDYGANVAYYQDARFYKDPIDSNLSLFLLAVSTLVLLIACANVANLVLARGTARVKELAIRMAIGASRISLIGQLLTESLLLAAAGGVAGIGVGFAVIHFFGTIPLPSDYPISLGIEMNTRLLTYALSVAMATGVVFGLLPALRSTRADLSNTIKASDQGPARVGFFRRRFPLRNILVAAQLTFSVVLLILSAVFIRGFESARHLDPGFRVDHTLFFSLDPQLAGYDETRTRQFYRKLMDRFPEVSGIEKASLSWAIPFQPGNQRTRAYMREEEQPAAGKEIPSAWSNVVDEHFFPVMEIKVTRGRAFDSRDTTSSPRVAVVNETFARRLWPDRDPIGQRFRLDKFETAPFQVIGIAKDAKYLYWAESPQAVVWTAFSQEYMSHMVVELRTKDDPALMATAVRAEVHALDADIPVVNMNTMTGFFNDRIVFAPRLIAQLVTGIGFTGLVLAIIGLYGVVAYSVSRRTREIGIRMAVGARPLDVLRMVLSQGLALTMIGIVLGVGAAIFSTRFIKDLVTGSPMEPATVMGVSAILALVMMLACFVPARRAASIDPTKSLREE
jgi:predicted permease